MAPSGLALDGAEIDLRRGLLLRDGAQQKLTTKEVELLRYLAEPPGVVVSFEELHDNVWQLAPTVISRAAYFTWRRLVNKVEPDPRHPANLISHHGDGVSFRAAVARAGPALALQGKHRETLAALRPTPVGTGAAWSERTRGVHVADDRPLGAGA